MDTRTTAPRLVWLDLETTGLDASTERILEVACLITDLDLNLVDGAGFQAVVKFDRAEALLWRSGAAPIVRDMHDATGLWNRILDGTPLASIESQLLWYITKHAPEPRQARLAGSSVRLDANFLDKHMPKVSQHLHYRLVDVSGVAYLANEWAGVPYFEKTRQHTAMGDIRESLAELRYLRDAGLFSAAKQ